MLNYVCNCMTLQVSSMSVSPYEPICLRRDGEGGVMVSVLCVCVWSWWWFWRRPRKKQKILSSCRSSDVTTESQTDSTTRTHCCLLRLCIGRWIRRNAIVSVSEGLHMIPVLEIALLTSPLQD